LSFFFLVEVQRFPFFSRPVFRRRVLNCSFFLSFFPAPCLVPVMREISFQPRVPSPFFPPRLRFPGRPGSHPFSLSSRRRRFCSPPLILLIGVQLSVSLVATSFFIGDLPFFFFFSLPTSCEPFLFLERGLVKDTSGLCRDLPFRSRILLCIPWAWGIHSFLSRRGCFSWSLFKAGRRLFPFFCVHCPISVFGGAPFFSLSFYRQILHNFLPVFASPFCSFFRTDVCRGQETRLVC